MDKQKRRQRKPLPKMDSEKNVAIYEKFKIEPDLLYSHLMELNTGVIAIIMTIIV
ncbi:hypothetical protein [Lactobacillus paragasseri]|uniref:hypothetical protein n=1 Tax=Lactobacillus paragasseri TaxID=2107999 RepID=UPI00207456B2|nr:hypothetical protein [Lactobacillus paragasseri]